MNLVPVSITIGVVTTIFVVLKVRSRSRITVAVLIGLTSGVLAGWLLEIVIGVLLQRELATTSASVFTVAFVLLATELLARSFLHLEKRFVELPERSAGSRSLAQQKTAAFYLEFDKVRLREGVRTDPRIDFSYWRELMEYRGGGAFTRDGRGNITGNRDVSGQNLNVVYGLRRTIGRPSTTATSRVICLGGSTTFCYEVPDDCTYPSQLQHYLNDSSSRLAVENHGVGGATVSDRLRYLRRGVNLHCGDHVVVLFGDNEVGINARPHPTLRMGVPGSRAIAEVITRGASISAIAQLARDALVVGEYSDKSLDCRRLHGVLQDLRVLDEITRSEGAMLWPYLQPNLFTKQSLTPAEVELMEIYPPHWPEVVRAGYEVLRGGLGEIPRARDISTLFDDLEQSPFLDWAHANSIGNKKLAEIVGQDIANSESRNGSKGEG